MRIGRKAKLFRRESSDTTVLRHSTAVECFITNRRRTFSAAVGDAGYRYFWATQKGVARDYFHSTLLGSWQPLSPAAVGLE